MVFGETLSNTNRSLIVCFQEGVFLRILFCDINFPSKVIQKFLYNPSNKNNQFIKKLHNVKTINIHLF
jgi:hypothetical protein